MKPSQTPAAGDTAVLIAEYVCGLLKPDEHAQVHALLSRDDQALSLALEWEERLLALVDALPREQPDPALRERLQRTLGIGPPPAVQPPPQPQLLQRRSIDPGAGPAAHPVTQGTKTPPEKEPALRKPAPQPEIRAARPPVPPPAPARHQEVEAQQAPTPDPAPPEPQKKSDGPADRHGSQAEQPGQTASGDRGKLIRKLWLWRFTSVCAATAAVAGFMLPGEPPPPPVQIVKLAPTRAAILQPPGSSSTPGWTATLDPQGNLIMRPLIATEVPPGSQVLLWTRSATLPEPRLLGRIDPNQPVQVPSAQLGALADDQLLEITLERDEDAARGLPNGPILFIGKMTVFGSETGGTALGSGEESAAGGIITPQPGP